MIRGTLAALRGDHARVPSQLAEAVRLFDAVEMRLCSAAVRRRLGELIGGDDGEDEVDRADRWMKQEKIQNPRAHGVDDPDAARLSRDRRFGPATRAGPAERRLLRDPAGRR